MTVFAALAHLLGLFAPALVTGAVLWLAAGLWRSGRQGRIGLGALWLGGCLVLLAGLVYFGRDGRVTTYAVLVLVQGSLVWWLKRR
jgi:hypothetical protein